MTTDVLSPKKKDLVAMGVPRYLKVCLMAMICSVAVLAATNSEPYVAVSTVACFLKYQSTGVLLTKWRYPHKDLPVAKQWFKLASMVVVVVTALPACSQEGFRGHYHIQSMSSQNLGHVERNSQVVQL